MYTENTRRREHSYSHLGNAGAVLFTTMKFGHKKLNAKKRRRRNKEKGKKDVCLLYTSDAADES